MHATLCSILLKKKTQLIHQGKIAPQTLRCKEEDDEMMVNSDHPPPLEAGFRTAYMFTGIVRLSLAATAV